MCKGTFEVDRKTKIRQAVCLAVAFVSLVVTVLMYFEGTKWLPYAGAVYPLLGGLIYYGNKNVVFVETDGVDT